MSFAGRVYNAVRKIPRGKAATYKSVAVAIGQPLASRAVALVLSKNFDVKVPCHGVVRSDGMLGGYNRSGPAQKSKLLREEGVLVKNHRINLKKFSILPNAPESRQLLLADEWRD